MCETKCMKKCSSEWADIPDTIGEWIEAEGADASQVSATAPADCEAEILEFCERWDMSARSYAAVRMICLGWWGIGEELSVERAAEILMGCPNE